MSCVFVNAPCGGAFNVGSAFCVGGVFIVGNAFSVGSAFTVASAFRVQSAFYVGNAFCLPVRSEVLYISKRLYMRQCVVSVDGWCVSMRL